MRQKIVTKAIIARKGRVLLLRRQDGRESIAGEYELPGGTMRIPEQPADALKRNLQNHTGIAPEAFKLHDVISFIDPDDSELQYLFILYFVDIANDARITLDSKYNRYIWRSFREMDSAAMTNATQVLLNLGGANLIDEFSRKKQKNDKNTDVNVGKNTTVVIHSDGGSRGNPGPTASAYIIENNRGEILDQGGEYLGDFLTNDIAEYYGVLLGLRAAVKLGAKNINFYSDSLMVINQLNGLFHVKELDRNIYNDIKKVLFQFDKVHFRHIHREYNRTADNLVNKILDENEPKTAR